MKKKHYFVKSNNNDDRILKCSRTPLMIMNLPDKLVVQQAVRVTNLQSLTTNK